jgi:hypothetical protein
MRWLREKWGYFKDWCKDELSVLRDPDNRIGLVLTGMLLLFLVAGVAVTFQIVGMIENRVRNIVREELRDVIRNELEWHERRMRYQHEKDLRDQ